MPQLPDDLRRKRLEELLYSIFDVETTGFEPSHERITEFGAQRVSGRRVESELSQLINPERELTPKVKSVTKMTDEMLAHQPKFSEVGHQIQEFMRSGGSLAVAHNARFDMSFLYNELRRAGVDIGTDPIPFLDTYQIAESIWGKQGKGYYQLGPLAERLGIDVGTTHRALADVDITRQVLDKLIVELRKKGIHTAGQLEDAGGITYYQPKRSYDEPGFANWTQGQMFGSESPATGQARADIVVENMKGMDVEQAKRHLRGIGVPDDLIPKFLDTARLKGYLYSAPYGNTMNAGRFVSSGQAPGGATRNAPAIGAELASSTGASYAEGFVNLLKNTPEKHREEVFRDRSRRQLAPHEAYEMRQYIFQRFPELASGLNSPDVQVKTVTHEQQKAVVNRPKAQVPYTGAPDPIQEDDYIPPYIPGQDDQEDTDPVTGFESEWVPPTPVTPTPRADPRAGQFNAEKDFRSKGRVSIGQPHVNMSWDFLKGLREIRYKGNRMPVAIRIKPIESKDGANVIQAEFTANDRTFSKRIEATPGGFQVDGRVIQYQQISPYASSRGVMPQKQLLKALRSAITYIQGADVHEYTTADDVQRIGQTAFSKYTEKFPGIPRNWHAKLKTNLEGQEGATWYKWSPQFMARMFAGTQIRTKPGQRRNAGEFEYYKFPGQEAHVSRGAESSPMDIDKMGRWMAWPVKAFRASSEVFTVADPKKAQDRYIAGFDARKAAKRLQIGAQELYPLLGKKIVESPFQLPGVPLPGRGETFMPPKERGQVIRAAVLLGGMLPEGMGQVDLPDTFEERFKTVKMPSGMGGGLPKLGKLGTIAGRYSKLLLGEGPQGESVHYTTGDWDRAELIEQYVDASREGNPALVSRIMQRIRTGDSTTSFKAQGMKALEISGTLPGQIGVEAVYPKFKNAVGFAHGVLTGFARGTEEERAYYDALKEKYGFSENWGGESQYEKIMAAAQEAVRAHTTMQPYRMSVHETMLEAMGLQVKGDRLVPIRGGGWEFEEGEKVTKKDLAAVGLGDWAAPKTKAGLLASRVRQNVPGQAGRVWDIMRVAPTYEGPLLRQARRESQGRQPFLGPEELAHIADQLSPDFAMQLRREGMKTTGPRAELWQSYESMPWRGNADRFEGSVGITEKDKWALAAEDQSLRGKEIDPVSRRLRAMQKIFGDQTIKLTMPNKRYTVDLPSPNTIDAFGAVNELGEQKNPLAKAYVDLITAATQGSKKDYGRAFNRYYRKMTEMVGSQEFQRKLAGSAPRFAYEGAMGADVALGPRQVVYSDDALARLAGLQMEDGSYDKNELKSFKQYVMDRANDGNPLLALTFRRPTSHAETQFGSAVTEILTQEMGAQLGATARGATVISPYLAGLGKGDVDADRYMSLLLNQGRVGYWRGGKGSWSVTRKDVPDQEWVDISERNIERPTALDPDADYFRPMIGLSGGLKKFIEHVPAFKKGARAITGWHQEVTEKFMPDKLRTGWWEIDTPEWAKEEFGTDMVKKLADHFRRVGGAKETGVYGRKTPWWNEMEKWRQENQDWSAYAKLKERGSWSKFKGEGGILHSMTPREVQQSYVNEMLNKTITMSAPYNMGRSLKQMGAEGEALGAFTAVAYQFGLDKALGQGEGEGPEGLKDLLSMWQSFTPYGGRRKEGSYAKLFDRYSIKDFDRWGRRKSTGKAGPEWRGQMYGGPAGLAAEVMSAMSKLSTETLRGHDAPPMRAEHVAQLIYGSATQEQIDAVKSGNVRQMFDAAGDTPMDMYGKPTMLRAIAARRAEAATRNRGWAPIQGNTWQPIWDDLVAEGRRINESTALVSRSYGVGAEQVGDAFYTYGSMPGGPDWLMQDVYRLSGMAGYTPDPSRQYKGGGPVQPKKGDDFLDWISEQLGKPQGESLIWASDDESVLSGYMTKGLGNLLRKASGRIEGLSGKTQEEIGEAGASLGMRSADISAIQHVVQQFQARPATNPQAQPQPQPVPVQQPAPTPVQPVSQGNITMDAKAAEIMGTAAGKVLVDHFKADAQAAQAQHEAAMKAKKQAADDQIAAVSSQYQPNDLKQAYVQDATKFLLQDKFGTRRSIMSQQDVAEMVSNTAANQIEQIGRDLIPGQDLRETVAGLSDSRLAAHLRATNKLTEFTAKRGWLSGMPAEFEGYKGMLREELIGRKQAQAQGVSVEGPSAADLKQANASMLLRGTFGLSGTMDNMSSTNLQMLAQAGLAPLTRSVMGIQGANVAGMSLQQLGAHRSNVMGLMSQWHGATGEAAPFELGQGQLLETDKQQQQRIERGTKMAEDALSMMGKEFGLTAGEARKARGLLGDMTDPKYAGQFGELPKALAKLVDTAEQQQATFDKYGASTSAMLQEHGGEAVASIEAQLKRGSLGTGGQRQLQALRTAALLSTPAGASPSGIAQGLLGGADLEELEQRAELAQLEADMTGGSRGGRVRTAAEGLLSEFSIGGTAFRMMAVNRLLNQPVKQWREAAGRYAGSQARFAMSMGGDAQAIMSTPIGALQAYQARTSDFQTGMGESALMSSAGLAGMAGNILGGGSSLQAGRNIGRIATPLMGGAEWALKGGMIAAAIGQVGGMLPATSALGGAMGAIGAAAGPIAIGAGLLAGGGLALGQAYQMGEPANVYREALEYDMGYRDSPHSLGSYLGVAMRLVGKNPAERARITKEYEQGAKQMAESGAIEIAKATIEVENLEIAGLDADSKMQLAGMLEFAGVKAEDWTRQYKRGEGEITKYEARAMMREFAPIGMMGGTERMTSAAIQAAGAMGLAPGSAAMMDIFRAMPQTEVGQYNFQTAASILGGQMGPQGMGVGATQITQVASIMERLEAGESVAQIQQDYAVLYGGTQTASSLGFSAGSPASFAISGKLSGLTPAQEAQVARTTQQITGIADTQGWTADETTGLGRILQLARDFTGELPESQMRMLATTYGTLGTEGYAPGSFLNQIANRGAPTDSQGSYYWKQAQQMAVQATQYTGGTVFDQNELTQQFYGQLALGISPGTVQIQAQEQMGQSPGQAAFGVMGGFATGEGAMPYTSQLQATQRASMAQFAAGKMGYSAMLGGFGPRAQGAALMSRYMEGMGPLANMDAQPLMSINEEMGGIYGLNQLEQRELSWDSMLAGQAFQMTGMQNRLGQQRADLASFQRISGLQRRQLDLQNEGRMLGLRQRMESVNLQYAQGMERAQVGFRQGTERLETGFRQGTEKLETGYRQQQESMALSRQMWDVQTGFQRQQMGVQWQGMMQAREWGREDMAYNQMQANRAYGWQQEDLDRAIRFATGREKEQLIRQKERSEETFATDTSRRQTEEGRQETVWAQEEAQFKAQAEHFEAIKSLETEQFNMQKAHMLENYQMSKAHMLENYQMQKAHMTENFEMSKRHMTESHAMQVRHINEQMALGNEQHALSVEIFEQNKADQERRLNFAISESERTIDYYENTVFPNQAEQKRLQDEVDDAYATFSYQQWLDYTKGGQVFDSYGDFAGTQHKDYSEGGQVHDAITGLNKKQHDSYSEGGAVFDAVIGLMNEWGKKADEIKATLNSINSGGGGDSGCTEPPGPPPGDNYIWDCNHWKFIGDGSATGGDIYPDLGPTLVGEQGPELVTPLVPSRVTPNFLTMATLAGGGVSQGNGVSVTIGSLNIKIEGVTGDAREIARAVYSEFEGAVNDVARNQALRGELWR